MVCERSRAWMRAALAQSEKPRSVVDCPLCGLDRLRVKDLYYQGRIAERYVYCPSFGAHALARVADGATVEPAPDD